MPRHTTVLAVTPPRQQYEAPCCWCNFKQASSSDCRGQGGPDHPALLGFSHSRQPTTQHTPQLSYFSCLLQQLDALGWDKVASLAPEKGHMILTLQDAAGRHHRSEVQLPSSFPVGAPAVSMQLPSPFKARWQPGDTLTSLAAQIQQALNSYQPLWEQLEDLDANTQLMDPAAALAKPYSNCSRCIALGNGATCQLQLSPAAPRALPSSVVFHGPSSVVAALQGSWYGSAHKIWQEQQSVRQNLEAVLQLQLPPSRPGVRKGCAANAADSSAATGAEAVAAAAGSFDADEDSDMDDEDGPAAGACAICYSMHLPDPSRPEELGAAPSVVCPAVMCGRAFHAMCLAEWLGALPNSRRVFDNLFGCCPFCNGPIGVSTRAAATGK